MQVDSGDDEGRAEHERTDRACDQAGTEILAGKLLVHRPQSYPFRWTRATVATALSELDIGDHRAEQQGEIGERVQVEAERAGSVLAPVKDRGEHHESDAQEHGRNQIEDAESACTEGQ